METKSLIEYSKESRVRIKTMHGYIEKGYISGVKFQNGEYCVPKFLFKFNISAKPKKAEMLYIRKSILSSISKMNHLNHIFLNISEEQFVTILDDLLERDLLIRVSGVEKKYLEGYLLSPKGDDLMMVGNSKKQIALLAGYFVGAFSEVKGTTSK